MQPSDLKIAFVQGLLAHYLGVKEKALLGAFFASDDYQKHVLPLFTDIEVALKNRWQRFSASQATPLVLRDFSAASPLPANLTHDSFPTTPSPALDGNCGADQTASDEGKELSGTHAPTVVNSTASHTSLDEGAQSGIEKSLTTPDTNGTSTPSISGLPAAPKRTAPLPKQVKSMPIKLEFTLPNANVGLEYSYGLLPSKEVQGITVNGVTTKEDFGLRYEMSTGRLLGTPTKAGEFEVTILFSRSEHPPEQITTRLIVNPDPKSLWKNLPSDEGDPYWKPDEDQQFIEGSDGWSLVAGSKRGRSHAQKGTFRDDDFFLYSQPQTGWQIAVVSDGAGSAKFSRRGSAIICKEGGEHLEQALSGKEGEKLNAAVEAWQANGLPPQEDDTQKRVIKNQLFVTLGYAAHFAFKRIREECERRSELGGVVKDYSSTILIGIAKRFPFGVFCASFNIGDGAIGVMHSDGSAQLLCEPDGGDFSGQTRFLSQDTVTQDELLKRLKFSMVTDFSGLYLMTDGISDPYFQTDKGMEMPERWAKLIQDVEAEAALSQRDSDSGRRLVSWLDFWSKGEHDDRTFAAIF